MLICFDTLFSLRDQWKIEILSQVMRTAFEYYMFMQKPSNFISHENSVLCYCPKFTSIKPSWLSKWVSIIKMACHGQPARPAATAADSGESDVCTYQCKDPNLPGTNAARQQPHELDQWPWFCIQNLWLPSWTALGCDGPMTSRGLNLDSSLMSLTMVLRSKPLITVLNSLKKWWPND